MRAHELLDLRVCIPLLAIYLISADMEKLVGEELRHLADKFIQKLVRAFAGGIHCGIEHSPLALDGVRARAAGQFRITDEPGSAVAWHVEFGYDADAAIP